MGTRDESGRTSLRWGGSLLLALLVVFAAAPAAAFAATGAVWVTQRDSGDTSNVQAFTIGSPDDLLTGPFGVGTGSQSYGIAVTPNDQYVYVTNDGPSDSTVSQYSVSPTTGALTALSPATVTVSASSGAHPESIAVDPSGSWAYTANPGAGTVTTLRIAAATGELTPVQEISTALNNPTGIATDPSGSYVYVTDLGSDNVTEFSVDKTTGALSEIGTVTVPQGSLSHTPAPIRITTAEINSNGYAFVTDNSANNQVIEFTIDPLTGFLSEATWASPDVGYPNGAAQTESLPIGLAVNPAPLDNSHDPFLFVAAGNVDEFAIDPSTGALGSHLSASDTTVPYTGGDATALAIAPDSNELYVGNSGGAGFISLYIVASNGTLFADSTPKVTAGTSPTTPVAGSLPSPVTPLTPVGGAISQLPYPNDCLTTDAFGCNTLLAAGLGTTLATSYQPVASPDGKFVYDVAQQGDLDIFSRDPSTGALAYVGCVSGGGDCDVGVDDLTNVNGMNNPQEMAISPDGASLYVVTAGGNALVEFTRNQSTGALTWDRCFSSTGASGCTAAFALDNPYGVAVSPDGTSVYTTSGNDSAISLFPRNPNTGLLTGAHSCITTNSSYVGCGTTTNSGDLLNPLTVQVSPDGNNVYVAAGGVSGPGDVVEFSRNPSTGALLQLSGANSCITTGTSQYPNCGTTDGTGFDGGTEDLAISPDGKNVYLNAFGDNGVIELSRNAATGALTQLPAPNACLAEETSPSGSPFSCTQPPYPQEYGTAGALGVAISPDGLDVYVSGAEDNAVASLSRDPSTGALTPIALPFGCITGGSEYTAGTCPQFNANGLYSPRRLTVSPDGTSVYVADQGGITVGGNQYGGDGVVELARQLPADLALSESGAPASAIVGGQITYTYTVTNGGPAAAAGPTLTVPLASELSLASASSSQGSCSGSTTVTCTIGALANGATATIQITAALATTGTASVTASVADALDTNTYNNSVTTATTITAPVKAPVTAPPPLAPLAQPVLLQSTDVAPVTGTVLVKVPGSSSFVPLSSAENIPMGSTIDATNGTVAITVALPNGTTETGDFYDGEFVVTQDATGRLFATLAGGSFKGCPASGKKSKGKGHHKAQLASAKKSKTAVVRQLWGSGHGQFTTKGRYGSAAVSGTVWLTQDLCEGTFFKVTTDTIEVTVYAHPHKKHLIAQGKSYLIKAPGF